MEKSSLVNMLDDEDGCIKIFQEGLETDLYSGGQKRQTIYANGLLLAYDPIKFHENPEKYVSDQLVVHKKYHDLARDILSSVYIDFNRLLDWERDNNRISKFVSDDADRILIEFSKLMMAPLYWMKLTTMKTEYKKRIETEKVCVNGYKEIGEIINYGKNFVEEMLVKSESISPEKLQSDLAEWKEIQDDMSLIYSRLVTTSDRRVQVFQRRYNAVFPDFSF